MNKLDAAKIISGLTDFETEQSPAPTNVHIITGEVGSTSEDGKVMVSLDGLVFSDDNDQFVEFDTLGGLEEGDTATILLTGENGRAMVPLAIGGVGTVDRIVERVGELYADYAEIGDLVAEKASITDLEAATARIGDLEADHVSVSDFQAEQANIDTLQANTADIDTIRANSAKVQNLTAAQLEADHATIGTLDTTYMHANMSNSDVAWIENGTIKNGAIVSAMINDVSANKLTAGTINGSVINVTNLNADNITAGTINGQRIGQGSLSLDKLSEDVYTESEVDSKLATMQAEIDGAIETWTGTAVPTLNNSPASGWTTNAVRDTHVGDVYFVVNSQSQQNGYNYRFTKSGSTYSWQLIKDSDVTNALQRLETAEGKITTFDSDISTLKTDTGTLTTRTTNLETRMSDAEDDILDKVDTTTFNEVSDTVDAHTQTISQHTTAIANKADSSTVTAVTNRVTKNEQDISGINTSIGQLQTTVESKADSSTVTTVSNKLNNVSDTVDGHTQSITSLQNTVSQKADGSTVSTLSSKVNTIEDTVDGHTSQLTSITSTQTTMQGTLDKTVKSSIQLWYSKANTTAPNKPTAQVTSTSTSGNAWRIVVPAYNASYPNYYYCWQYEYTDGTYGWSAVVRDIAMGESQATARTADSNASAAVTTANTASTKASTALTTANTANTNASEAKTTAETAASDASTAKTNAASAVSTANSASTTATNAQSTANANIKSSVQLWFTKANSTAPNKPTSVVSTSNANTANAWNLVVPVWNSSYPHYFYCYQQQKGDGTYQWTDVVYDRATSEAQQLANTTSTNLSTLQEDYATYKQTTTENVSSIGTRLTTAEGKISTAESNITQNATNINAKVSKNDVINQINLSTEGVLIDAERVEIDGPAVFNAISSNVDTAITNKGYATISQAQGYATTAETNAKSYADSIDVGGRNLLPWTTPSTDNLAKVSAVSAQNSFFTEDGRGCYKITGSSISGAQYASSGRYFVLLNASTRYIYSALIKVTSTDGSTSVGFNFSSLGHFTVYNKASSASDKSHEDVLAERVYSVPVVPVGKWVRVWFTFMTNSLDGSAFGVYPKHSLGDAYTLFICEQKLERGTKPTDWTPAPEDIVSRTQRIYYRWNSATAPTAPTTWVTKGDDGSALWTKMHVSITESYKYIYTCEQYEMADGTLGHTDVLLDNTITVIDGGNIITGSVTANKLNASDINASKTLTVGAMTDAAAATILNSNISVGGRNLLWNTGSLVSGSMVLTRATVDGDTIKLTPTTSSSYAKFKVDYLGYSDHADGEYTLSFEYRVSDDSTSYTATQLVAYIGFNVASRVGNTFSSSYDRFYNETISTEYSTEWTRASVTVSVPSELTTGQASALVAGSNFTVQFGSLGSKKPTLIRRVKLEKGNKPTDWSPAPEDVDAAVSDAAKTATNYITQVDQNGITIHPSGGTSNRAEIDADGMEVYKGNVSVASYGDTARIGKEAGPRVVVESSKLSMYAGSTGATKIAEMKEGSTGDEVVGLISTDIMVASTFQTSEAGPAMTLNALSVPDGSKAIISKMDFGSFGYSKEISGVNFGFSSATTNSNGITTFNPDLGVKPTAVFVAAGKASNETEAVAKIAVPMVWSIDSATQVQVRWQRSDTNAWLTNNAVGWYWLALA